jgi:hypothetical protein
MKIARVSLALLAVLGTAALAGCQTTDEDAYWGSETTVYRSGYAVPRGRSVWVDDRPVVYAGPRYVDRSYRGPPPRYERAAPPPRYDRAGPPPRYDRPAPPPPPQRHDRPSPGAGAPPPHQLDGLGPIGGRNPAGGGRRGPNGEWLPN